MQDRENQGPREENRTDVSAVHSEAPVEITGEDPTLEPLGEIATADGVFVLGGGKLPGNKDAIEQELDSRPHPVPGADPNNGVVPPNDRDLQQ